MTAHSAGADSGGDDTVVSQPVLRFERLAHGEGLEPPHYASNGAAGADLRAAIDDRLRVVPGERVLVPTGLVVAIPIGYEGQVRPRSGLALRSGLTVLNAPGTIDSDYRGELRVLLVHLGQEAVEIERGERVAQLVISPVEQARYEEVDSIGDRTDRGAGGFGSTGRG